MSYCYWSCSNVFTDVVTYKEMMFADVGILTPESISMQLLSM